MKSSSQENGFTLVLTLSLLILLVMVAVGMLSLSAIELRRSSQSANLEKARANARLALTLAVASLQKAAGPDQRITATSDLFDKKAQNRHWMNVWPSVDTTNPSNPRPWITRNGESGGLTDRRASMIFRNRILHTLVSGNEYKIQYTEDKEVNKDKRVVLVGEGTLRRGGASPSASDLEGETVYAPKVATLGTNGVADGNYAWWVGDLGVQANVATQDRSKTVQSLEIASKLTGQDADTTVFYGRDITNEERAKLATFATTDLIAKSNSQKPLFHYLTTESKGLLVDVRQGGWKKDLTVYLNKTDTVPKAGMIISSRTIGGSTYDGLSDIDNIVASKQATGDIDVTDLQQSSLVDRTSPNFGLLRSWAQRAKGASITNYKATQDLPAPNPAYRIAAENNCFFYSNVLGKLDDRSVTNVSPILVEAATYYNVTYFKSPTAATGFHLRLHLYPRVSLWNPYNFDLQVPASAVVMMVNGNKSLKVTSNSATGATTQTIVRMNWGGNSITTGYFAGLLMFNLNQVTLKPGQTIMFAPTGNLKYSVQNPASNTLSSSSSIRFDNSFYTELITPGSSEIPVFRASGTSGDVLFPGQPISWAEIARNTDGSRLQSAQNYMASWRPLTGAFTYANLINMPTTQYINSSYQYGDQNEFPIEWAAGSELPMMDSSVDKTSLTEPNRRTRDGVRLRWLEEHNSNKFGSAALSSDNMTKMLDESHIATWNMRNAISVRTPYDNVTEQPPYFYGIYTRDTYDDAVSFNRMMPKAGNISDPFDQPLKAVPRVFFDLPRTGAEIASLGAFQHVCFSPFIWTPSYALGNSLCEPRIKRQHTFPDRSDSRLSKYNGWNQENIGYATDGRSRKNPEDPADSDQDNWAFLAADNILNLPRPINGGSAAQLVAYDMSYELNHALWDAFFVSSGTEQQKNAFIVNPAQSPLPNGRLYPSPFINATAAQVQDFHEAASTLLVDGAFNVNSTSVEAWQAFLSSNKGRIFKGVCFPRMLNAPGGEYSGGNAQNEAAWGGTRVLNDDEVKVLAENIVTQVRLRGPFLSMSDFVNRRLKDDETGSKGALQAAIDLTSINKAFVDTYPIDNTTTLPNFKHTDNIVDPTSLEQRFKPNTTAWGAAGFLTQADMLQYLGNAMTVRSDTFRVRAYGESVDQNGTVLARAWCEAVVQRTPNYVDSTQSPMAKTKNLNPVNKAFGRKMKIVSFRWLGKGEV